MSAQTLNTHASVSQARPARTTFRQILAAPHDCSSAYDHSFPPKHSRGHSAVGVRSASAGKPCEFISARKGQPTGKRVWRGPLPDAVSPLISPRARCAAGPTCQQRSSKRYSRPISSRARASAMSSSSASRCGWGPLLSRARSSRPPARAGPRLHWRGVSLTPTSARRAQRLSQALATLQQEPVSNLTTVAEVRPLLRASRAAALTSASAASAAAAAGAQELALVNVIGHKSDDVRLLAACCIADVLRIFAPNPPYSEQQLKARAPPLAAAARSAATRTVTSTTTPPPLRASALAA
jgi:hypothetical protein